MARLGRIGEFDERTDDFESYIERFEHYVTANDVPDGKKKSVFYTVMG